MVSHYLDGDESISFNGISSSIGQDSPKSSSVDFLHPSGPKSWVFISSQTTFMAVNYFKLFATSS